MTNFSVQTINPVKIEDYFLIQSSDQCGVKEDIQGVPKKITLLKFLRTSYS